MHGDETAIRFPAGGLELEGRIAMPAAARGAAVVCHPHPQYGGSMRNNVVDAVVRVLGERGLATLRFNFRGVGASEGSYGGGRGEVADARGAVAHLRVATGRTSVALVGYSFGAAVVLDAGRDLPEVSHLVAIAPPVGFADLTSLAECATPKLFVSGDRDPYCPLAELLAYVHAGAEPHRLVAIDGADHFFAGVEERVAAAVAGFLGPDDAR